MKCLIDTNILLWYLEGNLKLPADIKEIIQNENNKIYISIASLWEMAIKASLGKLNLATGFENTVSIIENSTEWVILHIKTKHLNKVHTLEFYHNDPFDRLIISQAITEDMKLLYTDKSFDQYDFNNKS